MLAVTTAPSSGPISELERIVDLARRAGDLARIHLGRIERLEKRGAEAVTEADRAVQRLIAAELAAWFPDDGLIGEENDDGSAITNLQPRQGRRVWVVDPIDGTNNFVAGFGACAVCIGLLDAGIPVLGVVHDFTRDETWAAAVGHGSWLISATGRRALAVRHEAPAPSSLLMLTSNLNYQGTPAPWAVRWLTDSPWKVRMIGSAALECVQVAGGTALAAVTLNGKLWDVVAAAAVVLVAGGRVTTPAGTDLFPVDLRGYSGARLPFVAAGEPALAAIVRDIAQ